MRLRDLNDSLLGLPTNGDTSNSASPITEERERKIIQRADFAVRHVESKLSHRMEALEDRIKKQHILIVKLDLAMQRQAKVIANLERKK